jgi:RNA-directed DNA polymerase
MQAVQERICDQPVLKLLRVMLRAGVMEDGQLRRPVTGTPQGGLCSAEHKPPYAQCWVMRSADLGGLVGAGSAGERCA